MNEPTSRAGDAETAPRSGVDRVTGRHVIARLIGVDPDETVRAVVDQLSGEHSTIDTIVADAVADPDRIAALERLGVSDGARNPELDRLTALTAEALGTQKAAVTLVYADREVVIGTNAANLSMVIPLEVSISKFTVASREPLIVADTASHPLLSGGEAVGRGVRAYAGVPLIDADGHVLGTLCTWDSRVRHWASGQIQILSDLAEVVRRKLLNETG